MTNAIKVLLQMQSGFLQLESTLRTITIIKFSTSNFCHIIKITLNHALLKLSHER
jgi:hypothetical protein